MPGDNEFADLTQEGKAFVEQWRKEYERPPQKPVFIMHPKDYARLLELFPPTPEVSNAG